MFNIFYGCAAAVLKFRNGVIVLFYKNGNVHVLQCPRALQAAPAGSDILCCPGSFAARCLFHPAFSAVLFFVVQAVLCFPCFAAKHPIITIIVIVCVCMIVAASLFFSARSGS